MIITEPQVNDGNYTTIPDSISEHIYNNRYSVILRGMTDLIIRNEYTEMANEITQAIINEYTETVHEIT